MELAFFDGGCGKSKRALYSSGTFTTFQVLEKPLWFDGVGEGAIGAGSIVAPPVPHFDRCISADQLSRCLEMIREISTIDVFPVNSNFTFPSDEK